MVSVLHACPWLQWSDCLDARCTQHAVVLVTHVLRNMRQCVQSAAELVLRADTPFNYCVIDEVDSILIDEARTPLIISGPSDKPSDKYYKVRRNTRGMVGLPK